MNSPKITVSDRGRAVLELDLERERIAEETMTLQRSLKEIEDKIARNRTRCMVITKAMKSIIDNGDYIVREL